MKTQLVILFSILLFTLVSAKWRELLTVSCDGSIHTVDSNGLFKARSDFSRYWKIANAIHDEYKYRVKCFCPNLSDENFERYFLPYSPHFLFSMFDGQNFTSIPGCDVDLFNYPFKSKLNTTFVFPSTCNAASYASGQGCLVQVDWNNVGVKLGLSVQKCPGSSIPYLSILCDGPGCDVIGKPCSSNNDKCGAGYTCAGIKVTEYNSTLQYFFPNDSMVFSALQSMRLYSTDRDTFPGCYPSSSVMTDLYNYITHFFDSSYSITTPQTRLEMCMPEGLSLDSEFAYSVIDLLKLNKCQIEYGNTTECYNYTCGSYFNSSTGQYDYLNCTSCNYYSTIYLLDCTGNDAFLRPWNGQTSDGRNSLDPKRLDGSYFGTTVKNVEKVADDDEVLFSSDCDGNFNFFPGGDFDSNFFVAGLVPTIELGLKEIKTILECRSQQSNIPYNEEIFNIRYGLEGLLYYLTVPVMKNPNMIDFADWTGSLSTMTTKLNIPTSCNYKTFVEKKTCAVQYNGFKSLFGIDINLRAKLTKCSNGYPKLYVGCKGTDCAYLKNYKLCNEDSDCSATTKCNLIVDLFNFTYFESNDYNSTDPLYFGLFKRNISDTCYRSFPHDLKKDIHNILYSLKGGAKDYSGTASTGICFVDPVIIKNVNFSSWAQGQVIVDQNTITLRDLLAWEAGLPEDTSSAMTLLFSLLLLIVVWLI